MRRAGPRAGLFAAALVAASCRTAPHTAAPLPVPAHTAALPPPAGPAPQPGKVIAQVGETAVLALEAPSFPSLGRDQRMLAYRVARAESLGEAVTLDQGYRHNVEIVHLLRGILSRPQMIAAPVLEKVRAYARAVWLNRGIHDAQTGRKLLPSFGPSELRAAALAAQAAGADLGVGSVSLEYALRALEAPLFDPHVDAQRTVHGADLTASAVNLYDSVRLRDLRSFHERSPLNSRLVKDEGVVSEQVLRLPSAAAALDEALANAAPPQRAVLEPLSSGLRTGDPEALPLAQRAWLEAAGPVDFFLGFLDTGADPRGRKALFGGFVGLADAGRTQRLAALAEHFADPPRKAEALFLAAAAGAMRPLPAFGFTVALPQGQKSALFAGALDAAAALREPGLLAALAEPALSLPLQSCAAELRFALLALREVAGRSALDENPALAEARADAIALTLAAREAPSCGALVPAYAATHWLASAANQPDEGRVEDDRQRAQQLEIWWFTAKGALAERTVNGHHAYVVPDRDRFYAVARELAGLLHDIAKTGDAARANDLLDVNASRVDPALRDEVRARLRAAGVPLRVAVLPPRLELQESDVQAVPVTDLDAQVLSDFAKL